MASTTRNVRVFRYDPTIGGEGDFQTFRLECPDESAMTMLDVLLRIQREQDPTIAFRFACRVSMCGSCGMVINGKERLACKTNVSAIPAGQEITLRPMNHFPVIKDLVVDMDPLFSKMRQSLSFFEPKEQATEPARIPPDAPERDEIRIATDCIACGCCVSSCTMADHHDDFAGPAALARAYSLIADSRDGMLAQRLAAVLQSTQQCRTEMNCTAVCPKGISPTRAIKFIERVGIVRHNETKDEPVVETAPPEPATAAEKIDRATFLRHAGIAALGAAACVTLGGVAAVTTIGPKSPASTARWLPLAKVSDLPPGEVTTVMLSYEHQRGIYTDKVSTPVLISRLTDDIVCYKTACSHLGCTVHWDAPADQFRCACHGGAFDRRGNVTAGPPPRPMDRYETKIQADQLMVLV
jgi:succinate dehydrogenase / fumarate reductase iron-sulfur subunit